MNPVHAEVVKSIKNAAVTNLFLYSIVTCA